MSGATAFRASVVLVLEQTRTVVGALRRQTRTKLLQFAVDVCLVAHGVRSGYLVDAVSPQDPAQTFAVLLDTLRTKSSVFKDVVFWHHAPAMQSFLVHVSLLQDRLAVLLGRSGTGDCVFVRLDDDLSVSSEPPDGLRGALQAMNISMENSPDALSHSLSDAFAEEILIPLAAVVIDYPVAYFPAFSAQSSFLAREPLDIYTITLGWTSTPDFALGLGKEHALFKFSCPQVLVGDHPELSPRIMVESLQVKFASRIERLGMRIFLRHQTQTLDRVAL